MKNLRGELIIGDWLMLNGYLTSVDEPNSMTNNQSPITNSQFFCDLLHSHLQNKAPGKTGGDHAKP
jgi:hypothetical protein